MTKWLLVTLGFLLGLLVVLVSLPASARVSKRPSSSPRSLQYVESSDGLIPPELESGRTEVEMADVNADGKLDLVCIGDHGSPYINTDEHGVMVWFGDGTGSWSVHQTGDFGYGGVALGDVNGDGHVDVGYGMHHNYSGTDLGDQLLEVALGDGTGQNWVPWDDGLATNGEDWGMFATDFADVNNDGRLDVGSISFGCCAGVHVYLNQGDGTWQQSFGTLGGNSDMHFAFGDVNGDGNPDLAVSHQFGTVYAGDGLGGFSLEDGNLPPLEPYATRPGVSLGDVDHDGRADIAFCTPAGGVAVWKWVATGVWQNLSGDLPTSGLYEATQLFDMNMDGHRDVVAFGYGQLRIWGGDGLGGWTEIGSFSTPSPGYFSALRVGGDADHNGYPDIAIVAKEGAWPSDQNHARFFREATLPAELAIEAVFPSGHEVFGAGGIAFVDWISAVPDHGSALVRLELSLSGPDGPWEIIADGLPDSGRFQWEIPSDLPYTEAAFLRYRLQLGPEVAYGLTPAAFTILGIPDEPIVGLEATNDSPTLFGEPTSLTATVTSGTSIAYAWAFGDGALGEGETVSHEYEALGHYAAVVTASNSVSLVTATTTVTVTDAPIEGLQGGNDSPTALGQATALTATVASGTNVDYAWAFGDGSSGEGEIVTHEYEDIGLFAAVVTASNSVSLMTATTSVTVTDVPIEGLQADSNSPSELGQVTMLTATIASGTNVNYIWAFGDGEQGAGSYASHAYPAVGLYTTVVTASNSVSAESATTLVSVADTPISGLVASNDGPTLLGSATTHTATIQAGTSVTYVWSLGDSTRLAGPTVVHTYSVAGAYAAVVTVANSSNWLTATTTVVVLQPNRFLYLPLVMR